jgi:hypothetical protein
MIEYELAHPHDLLVRRFLVEPELMADLLTYYPKKVIDRQTINLLDLRNLRCESPVQVDKNLIEAVGDLRFSTNFKKSKRQSNVFLLFEHQSKIDRRFRVRGLDYIIQSFKRFEENSKGKEKFPYPIVVVLYSGKVPWKELLEMDEMIEMVPGTEQGLLKFPLILIDISAIPVNHYAGHPALQALIETLQLASAGNLLSGFDDVTDKFIPLKNDPRAKNWLHSLVRYALAVAKIGQDVVIKSYSKLWNEREVTKMAKSTMEELWLQGKTEAIRTVLKARFHQLPQPVVKTINSYSDPKTLESLTVLAATCRTLDEFKAGLK